jgi:hypothetical protein
MYNNLLRKLTSLTLLTILLASSAVFALPNAMPQAHAQVASHPNLFVSAENSQYNNYFAGPQVVQVIVADPDINRLDQAYGEPIVTVNGVRLRMAQGTDGNWYGYFADRKQAEIAGHTAATDGKGLNFGFFCGPSSTGTGNIKGGLDFGLTKGFTIARIVGGVTGGSIGNATTIGSAPPTCTFPAAPGALTLEEHVIRQNKTLNNNPAGFAANAMYSAVWPIIQLEDFSSIPTAVTVDYSKAGGDQIVNLTFDRIPSNLISVTPDRTAYPDNAQVFLTMNDPKLNIDPTQEDSWTWGSNAGNNTLYYQAFDRNGIPDADGTKAMQNIVGNLTTMMFNHNGKFTFNPTAQSVRVVDFQSNAKQLLNGSSTTRVDPATVSTSSIKKGSQPITFIETGGVNTGVLANWDGAKKSNIETTNNLNIRGQSATFRYNDISGSVVGGFAFGTIAMTATNNTWASGQRIPVTVTDMDANHNSKLTEHMNFFDPTVERFTAQKIGHPFTMAGLSPESALLFTKQPKFTLTNGISTVLSFSGINNATDPNISQDEPQSFRPIFTWQNSTAGATSHPITIRNGGGFTVDTNSPATALFQSIHNSNTSTTGGIGVTTPATSRFHGFNFINFDFRSFTSLNGANGTNPTAVNLYLVFNPTGIPVVNPVTGLANPGNVAISLVNGSSLQNFVNLNGTAANQPPKTITGANFDSKVFSIPKTADVGFMFLFNTTVGTSLPTASISGGQVTSIGTPAAADFFSIGIIGDGLTNDQRINNGVYRYELEETGDNTGVFTGTNQFLMLNQLNIFDPASYAQLVGRTISHDVLFVAIQDMVAAQARAPQVTYLDHGADGVDSILSAQQDIPTHTGVVSFDMKTYKIADTVTVSLNDPDLNTNNDLVVIYTAVTPQTSLGVALSPVAGVANPVADPATDTIGKGGLGTYSDGRAIGRLLDVQFGQQDIRWSNSNIPGVNANTPACFTEGNVATVQGFASGLSASQFSLVETAAGSGIFQGTFEIPDQLCQGGVIVPSTGQNIKVNYVDFRDSSGKLVEVSDNAGIRGNTGSVKLDKAVYPVPFGSVAATGAAANSADFAATTKLTSKNGVFPMHRDTTGTGGSAGPSGGLTGINAQNTLKNGDVLIHARVNDPDFSLNPTGTSTIAIGQWDGHHGPVAFQISRQGQSVLLATAGGPAKLGGHIEILNGTQLPAQNAAAWSEVRELGPMVEITPAAGIFQADLPIRFTDGPPGTDCATPDSFDGGINGTGFSALSGVRFNTPVTSLAPGSGTYCVRQGDVLTITYFDPSDASGHPQTVTDSATFDLRNGVLQSDKSVYIIGSDMILTLVEPDLNLDSQTAETVPLDVVEWDSHAFKGTMGPLGGQTAAFDAKPSTFVETGKDTGIFQAVIKIPKILGANLLERGEQIHLEYTDWGPAGSKTVGSNNQDIELTIYTSNFGATVELDQKVYTWTDRVYITVVAPDHNFDPNLVDTIGDNPENKVTVSTRGHNIAYKLTETGVDTGIFSGYVILTGDNTIKGAGGVDGAGQQPASITGNGQPGSCVQGSPCGPTDGFLQSEDSDGVSVSFEFTRDQTVTGSALIRWNIGEIKWLQPSYPANGQGVLQIVDPDMNLNPKAVDKFDTNVWSDSDSGGIKLTMTETGQDTGIFQCTVYFSTYFQSSGNRVQVAEGDKVTGVY